MSHPLIKPLEQLLDYLRESQGGDLKSLLDEGKESPEEEKDEPKEMPHGMKVDSIEIMKPKDGAKDDGEKEIMDPLKKGDLPGSSEHMDGMDSELSDDELKELLAKYC